MKSTIRIIDRPIPGNSPGNSAFPRPSWFLAAVVLMVLATNGLAADRALLPPLSSVPGNPRLPGKFVWADLVTDDVAAAQRFYSGLFGWNFRNLGGYTFAANEDRPLAGIFQKPRPEGKQGQPRWFGYISVPNVARAQSAVTKAGDRVLAAPQDFLKLGEQAVFAER